MQNNNNKRSIPLERMDEYLDWFYSMMINYDRKNHQTIYKGETVSFSETKEIDRFLKNNKNESVLYFVDNYSHRRNGFIEYMFLKCCELKKYQEALTIAQKYKKYIGENLVMFAKLPEILAVDKDFLLSCIYTAGNKRATQKLIDYFNCIYNPGNIDGKSLVEVVAKRSNIKNQHVDRFYTIHKNFINKELGVEFNFNLDDPYQFDKYLSMIIKKGLLHKYYSVLKENGMTYVIIRPIVRSDNTELLLDLINNLSKELAKAHDEEKLEYIHFFIFSLTNNLSFFKNNEVIFNIVKLCDRYCSKHYEDYTIDYDKYFKVMLYNYKNNHDRSPQSVEYLKKYQNMFINSKDHIDLDKIEVIL